MTASEKRAKDYLHRAEELRTLADEMKHDEPRETMLRIAADYEKWATKYAPLPLSL